jgi:hypothetical protein
MLSRKPILDVSAVAKHIAAAVEVDAVLGRARDPLDEIDAAVHEGRHLPVGAGPPVPVGLCGLVGGQRERVAGLDQHNILDPVLDGEK